MAKKEKQPGPGLWPSIILTGLGITLLIVGGWFTFQSVFDLLVVESFDTPGSYTDELDVGDYEIYGQVASVDFFDLGSTVVLDRPIAGVDDVTVTNRDTGERLRLTSINSEAILSRQSSAYGPIAGFEVTSKATYEVEVRSSEPSRAVSGRTIESGFEQSISWLVLSAVGALLSLIGGAMLITGIVRRLRAKKRGGYVPPAGYPAPGYMPATPQGVEAPAPLAPNSSPIPPAPSGTPLAPPGSPAPHSSASPTSPAAPPRTASPDPHVPDTETPWS